MATSMIGDYGVWAASLAVDSPGSLSLRTGSWDDLSTWRNTARARVRACLGAPELGETPTVVVRRRFEYDGLQVEELSWQLPAGRPSEAIFLKPAGATGRLPAVLALHDHGGIKYFGKERIADNGAPRHPIVAAYMAEAYAGVAWANALAQRGFAVLVPDAFAFGSRRVRLADVPDTLRPQAASDDDSVEAVERYNAWAGEHETVMAKSLFAAGVTWPGVWLAEDLVALDILCDRPDVDAARVGCGGLSAGGLRTVYLAGLDDRIACAVCAGMITTWRDLVLNISARHTWMAYVPHLPRALDYPEILGLRAPLPTLVMNNSADQLFTLSEMQRADEMLANVYQRFGAGERYRCSYYPGPHKFDLAMQEDAFAWWEAWL